MLSHLSKRHSLVLAASLYILPFILASTFSSISHPDIRLPGVGGEIGLFGSFDSLSFFSYKNASSFLHAPDSSQNSSSNSGNHLYVRDSSNNAQLKFANVNGDISQILPLSDDTVVINGQFTKFNDVSYQPPIIYNISSKQASSIFPNSSSSNKRDDASQPSIESGNVTTMYVDNELIYLGGNFKFNNTYGAAIYNVTSKSVYNTPFHGFGENATVNAITKITFDDDANSHDNVNQGSIVFGGDFNTLGLKDLLSHNISSNSTKRHHNNTNGSYLVTAEQIISIKHGTFSNVNGAEDGNENSIICPASGKTWSVKDNVGGQWAVELPNEAKGVYPTKARIYVPDDENAAELFRIYTYPNNGIMNISYIDPETHDLAYCDAWCPLKKFSQLKNYTQHNKKHQDDLSDDMTYVDDDGSYSTYYNDNSSTNVLGYGANYQEFSFENSVSIDKVGVTIVGWYGSHGAISGFELYSDSILVYGNDTLNEPNCDDDDNDEEINNYSITNKGQWQSVTSLSDAVQNTDYYVSVGSDGNSDAEITLYPNISYSGNYSLLFSTPGCTYDNSCEKRSIVNVSVIDHEDKLLSSKLIYQNNNNNKFDYLYYGHLKGTTDVDGHNKVKIEFHDTIGNGIQDPWVVVDKVTANVAGLDDYLELNSTNSTRKHKYSKSDLTHIKLHSLFEYSLANFTDFDESKVSYKKDGDKIISDKNNFVGNSSINVLSSELSSDSVVDQFNLHDRTLTLLGNFDSHKLSLSSENVVTLSLGDYNQTANEAQASLEKRDHYLFERDDKNVKVNGASFNDSISEIASIEQGTVYLGKFTLEADNTKDLSNNNKTGSGASNFAIFTDSNWFGFGNDYLDIGFNRFTNITLNDHTYFIFAADDDHFMTWDNTEKKWITDENRQINISQAVNLDSKQQVLGGSSFNFMDYYKKDQGAIVDQSEFKSYNFNVTGNDSEILSSYYINESMSVIGGKFRTDSKAINVGFIDSASSGNSIVPLNGNIKWQDDASVQSLYVDSNTEYLFIGTNGTATIDDSKNSTGILIYDLKNGSFTDFQPAELSNDGAPLTINTIVLYDKGDKLLVGGDFTSAGSLQCVGLCVYDIENTRWMDPASSDKSPSIDGYATEIKFFKSNEVIISGNFTIDSKDANFITYNFDKGMFSQSKTSLNKLGSSKTVQKFIINDETDKNLNGRFAALGSNFIVGYDGSRWGTLDSGIEYSSYTTFTDLKLIPLTKDTSSNSKQTYFDKNKALLLSGVFELTDYGLVNAALYDGSKWIPYVYSSHNSNEIGKINSILIKDAYRFTSSDDIVKKDSRLSSGKVVGISLACALGSTTLVGLLYIIPYFMLFRKSKEPQSNPQRIEEKDMMDAVNPEYLIREIDLQRNT